MKTDRERKREEINERVEHKKQRLERAREEIDNEKRKKERIETTLMMETERERIKKPGIEVEKDGEIGKGTKRRRKRVEEREWKREKVEE